MKKIIYLCLFFPFLYGQESPYKKFQTYMNEKDGRILNIHISQEQLGEHFNSNGILYYFENKEYVFDTYRERIAYKDGTITTINKATKQIIYDMDVANNLTVLDILSGKDDRVIVADPILEKDSFRIPFILSEWDIKGDIWTVPTTGKPKKIILNISVDEIITLKIITAEIASKNIIPQIDTIEYEIIDLRE